MIGIVNNLSGRHHFSLSKMDVWQASAFLLQAGKTRPLIIKHLYQSQASLSAKALNFLCQ